MTSNVDDFLPHNVTRGKPLVEETVSEVRRVLLSSRCLDADVPEDLLVISHDLEQNGVVSVPAGVNVSRVVVVVVELLGAASELDGSAVYRSADVGERGELLEALSGFDQAAFADGDLDELGVELGGEEAGDHVGDLGDEVGI